MNKNYVKSTRDKKILTSACVGIIVFIVFMAFVSAGIVMAVWNWVLVPIFHIQALEWFQAFLIYVGVAFVGGLFQNNSK